MEFAAKFMLNLIRFNKVFTKLLLYKDLVFNT